MSLVTMYVVPVAVLLFALGILVAWSFVRTPITRWSVILGCLALIPGTYFTISDLLSRPKPVSKEYFAYHAERAEIVGFHQDTGQALYLYLVNGDYWDEPRSFSYPWNEETEELVRQLKKKWAQRNREGGKLFLNMPFEPSLEREEPLLEHDLPQPKLPEKFDPQIEKPEKEPKKFEV